MFLLSILNDNVVGAVLIFFLLWGYFYYSTTNNQVIKATIDSTHVIIGNKSYPRSSFVGYVVEVYAKSQEVKNIVFVTPKSHLIYTFDDSLEHIQSFLLALDGHLPMLEDFHQTSFEKLSRKIKL